MITRRRRRRGIYVLPTTLTLGNLFAGCAALMLAPQGQVQTAALFIIAAVVLDGLDGRLARLTGTTSEFGREFDSLADIVSFGVAPAMLAFHWGLGSLGRLGWAIAFVYVACAATRLARFNLHVEREAARYFAGLPSPPAGGTIATVVFAFPALESTTTLATGFAIFVVALALLMVSHVRYRSFKEVDLHDRRSTLLVVPLALAIALIVAEPKVGFSVVAAVYVLSAPVVYILGSLGRLVRRQEDREDSHETVDRGAR